MADFKAIFKQFFSPSQEGGEVAVNSPFRGLGDMGDNLVRKTKGDKVIWAIVIILTLASLLLVYSSTGSLAYRMSKSTESYLFKQFAFIMLGLIIIYFAQLYFAFKIPTKTLHGHFCFNICTKIR